MALRRDPFGGEAVTVDLSGGGRSMADDSGYHDNSPTALDYAFAEDLNIRVHNEGDTLAQAVWKMGLSEAYVAWLERAGLV